MQGVTLEKAMATALSHGITPDGFAQGDDGRAWQWDRDYPVLLRTLELLEGLQASPAVQPRHPSAYWLKHRVENDLGVYVSQGTVILAWVLLGRKLERHPGGLPGAFLAVSRRDPTYKRWMYARNVA